MPPKYRQFVSFDWAMKKLLRSKANFDVLEGFLSELLKDDVHIIQLLESESDREHAEGRINRVDLLVSNRTDQRIIIEVQYERESDYFHRMLFGAAKVVTENIRSGEPYGKVKKVISVNIVYFDLGQGKDYVYVGKTQFTGMHQHDILELSDCQKRAFDQDTVSDIFPDYYILKVNQFNDVAKDGLDEWIYFLKNEELPERYSAKGLDAAKEKLDYMKLSDSERRAFERHEEELRLQASIVEYSVKEAERAKAELSQTRTIVIQRETELEEERRQKEEERRQKEEERRLKEEAKVQAVQAQAQAERAVRALAEKLGISENDARKMLE